MTPFKPWDPAPNCVFNHKKKTPPPPDLISICLTHYNYTDYVIECLDSLAEQTHKALDLVFIDDASTQDNTIPLILSWLESNKNRFYRIVFLENKYNQGPSFSRNMAFKHALAPSVFIIDADNMLYPEALENFMLPYSMEIFLLFTASLKNLEIALVLAGPIFGIQI